MKIEEKSSGSGLGSDIGQKTGLTLGLAFLGKYLARMASMCVWMYSSQSSSGASHTIFMSTPSSGATRLCTQTMVEHLEFSVTSACEAEVKVAIITPGT